LVSVLDTTLREGEQTPGVYFDRHIKLAIASLLEEVGVDIIESGHPAVTEEIYDAVSMICRKGFKAKIGAHARSVEGDVQLAMECGVDFLGIFYCVSDERLNGIFRKDLKAAIEKICEVIRYAKERNPDLIIRYTPEDTVRSSFENVLTASAAAVAAGADIISVADTTGYMIPGTDRSMYDYVVKLKEGLADQGLAPKIAVHCHNDRGLALANALDGFRAGAGIIDASVLGLGERAGIVDLATLLTILAADFGQNHWNLEKLGELYKLVSKHAGIDLPVNYPVMGENAFTHCAGVHTHAASENPMHYESLSPRLVGRQTQFSLDHMSGIASLRYALEQIDYPHLDNDLQIDILKEVKKIGQRGRIVDLEELKHIVDACKHHKRFSA
jgi:2-isopropylmalate synthase